MSQLIEPANITTYTHLSTWYTKVDYFHWNERIDGADFVTERGALFTLGYAHCFGRERIRAEIFGNRVDYEGDVQFDDGTTERLSASTNYLGLRAELEVLAEPDWWPGATLFAGIGNRFWFRDLPDSLDEAGNFIEGYQETWWTIYPYVGIEKRRSLADGWEFFGASRVGMTAITYDHVSFNDAALYPRLGITAQNEFGLRGKHVFLSGQVELFTWNASHIARDSFQPVSTLLLVGLKTGVSF